MLGKTGAQVVIESEDDPSAGNVIVTQRGKRAKIGNLHVKSSERNRGFGKSLISAAIAWEKPEVQLTSMVNWSRYPDLVTAWKKC